ncbi:MAG: sarcosine oxidase subunit gamma family protein [Ardenticatenaceae bacterium]
MVRLSPLYQTHLSLNARFGEVSEWKVAQSVSQESAELSAARDGVALSDLSDRAKVMVEGALASELLGLALGVAEVAINSGVAVGDDTYVYRLRRDRFYVSAPTGQEAAMRSILNAALAEVDGLVTVTDMTNGRAELLLAGPNSATCLSRVCGLDFYETKFPNHTAKQSSVAKTRQLIMRRDIGDLPAYYISGGRSFAVYLWKIILEAGQDLAIRPIGRKTVAELGV